MTHNVVNQSIIESICQFNLISYETNQFLHTLYPYLLQWLLDTSLFPFRKPSIKITVKGQ
jgi:hypothetical protein